MINLWCTQGGGDGGDNGGGPGGDNGGGGPGDDNLNEEIERW